MILKSGITAVLAVRALILAMRYNMHMFQLNGYKNNEQISWIRKNFRQQWILQALLIFGILRFFSDFLLVDIFLWFLLYMAGLVYSALKRLNTKKKLVYTARVKRMLVTETLVLILLLVAGLYFKGIEALAWLLPIMTAFQLILNIVANTINKPIEHGVNQYYINDAKKKLKSVENLTVIGVTGSYGKTSVKFYLQTLLQEYFNVLVTPESFNTPMGVVKTIRGSLKPAHEIFICEMGARYEGDIKEICDIVHPKHGIITSIGPQHLETFGSLDVIKKTKFELADALPAEGMLFVNGDNEYIREYGEKYSNKIKYHSFLTNSGYYATDIEVSQFGTSFIVVAPSGEKESYQMKLIGEHNVINVVGAIAVANTLGVSLEDLKLPVRRIQPVPHRMQMREHGAVTIIDDAYNSNPVGSKAAVETLKMFDGTRILITPGMVELGTKEEEYNYKFGTYAAKCCDYILLVGKKHTQPIMKGALESGFPAEKCIAYDKLEEALTYAYSIKSDKHKYILLENDLPDNY